MKNAHGKTPRKMPAENAGGNAGGNAEALRRMGAACTGAAMSLGQMRLGAERAQQELVKLGAAMRKVQPDVSVAQAAIQGVQRASDKMLEALQRDRERRAAWQSMAR